jgi:hypothetical protein
MTTTPKIPRPRETLLEMITRRQDEIRGRPKNRRERLEESWARSPIGRWDWSFVRDCVVSVAVVLAWIVVGTGAVYFASAAGWIR